MKSLHFKLKQLPKLLPIACAVAFALQAPVALSAEHELPKTSPEAKLVPHSDAVFGPDPSYEDKPYSDEAQLKIYGGKFSVPTPRPLLELGRPQYQNGPLKRSGTALGLKNPIDQSFSIYGDMRVGAARNINGATQNNVLAARLNVDMDYRFTGTERIHAFFRPLDNGTEFTRCEFNGSTNCTGKFDAIPDALFFEGDLNAITTGLTDKYQSFDMAFAVGKMPLLFQNGLWFEDAIIGGAATLPAKNSKTLGISNMDITFFGGTSATSGAQRNGNLPLNAVIKKQANIYGVATFIEANEGYWEIDYAYTDTSNAVVQTDRSYHNLGLAFTRRYGNWLSNSIRIINNFGQDPNAGGAKTANGTLIVLENSLVTRLPSTLVPYMNVFYGTGTPQSASRAADAGGILKNIGINFETDGLTGFPKLTDAVHNMWGGAVGVEYLFGLNRQLVVEAATTQRVNNNSSLLGREYGWGMRYQFPLDQSWIFRTDAILADRENNRNLAGLRFELRRKF